MNKLPADLPEFGAISASGTIPIVDQFGNEGYCLYIEYEDGKGERTLIVSQVKDNVRINLSALHIASMWLDDGDMPTRYFEHEIYKDGSWVYNLCVFDTDVNGRLERVRRTPFYDSELEGTQPIHEIRGA